MYHGELLMASSDSLAVTNHAIATITQRLTKDRKAMIREFFIECQHLFTYDGQIKENDVVDGVIRIQIADEEVVKYYKGIVLSLNMGLVKIRLDKELQDDNVEQFLKRINRYEFSR